MPQCQFLFSVVFGFRKVVQKIFSEWDRTKPKFLICPSKDGVRSAAEGEPQGGHKILGRGQPWARA